MIKKICAVLCFALVLSCDQSSSKEDITHLNGYWQIHQVQLKDGSVREFRFSELVDYIELQDRQGYRKKMRPQLDGTFKTSADREKLLVKVENDSINLYYETAYNTWKETLISSEEDEIKILNPDGTVYTYKRFTPYSINHGEENQ